VPKVASSSSLGGSVSTMDIGSDLGDGGGADSRDGSAATLNRIERVNVGSGAVPLPLVPTATRGNDAAHHARDYLRG
jgi:hypothetical protein